MSHEDDLGKREKLEALAAAMTHPVRSRVLLVIAGLQLAELEEDAGESRGITIRQIAESTGRSKRSVRHHVDVLQRQGLVRILDARMEGGVFERFYGPSQSPFLGKDDLVYIPVSKQQKLVLETLRMIFADASSALRTGAYTNRPEWVALHFMTEVDEQGWHELAGIHERARIATERTLAEARERLANSGETPIRFGSCGLLFEAAQRAESGS